MAKLVDEAENEEKEEKAKKRKKLASTKEQQQTSSHHIEPTTNVTPRAGERASIVHITYESYHTEY